MYVPVIGGYVLSVARGRETTSRPSSGLLRSCSDSIAIALGCRKSEPEERSCELVLESNDEFKEVMAEPTGTARHSTVSAYGRHCGSIHIATA